MYLKISIKKITTGRSYIAIFASVYRCWPFCFIPLLMSRDKKRMQCPHCGHNYDICSQTDKLVCPPKCQSSHGKLSDFTNSRQCRFQTECNGSQIQSDYRYHQVSRITCVNYINRSNCPIYILCITLEYS